MTPSEVFSAVSAEFSQAAALRVVAIHAIHLTQKIKEADLATSGSFSARLEKRARKALWAETPEDFSEAFKIAMALYDFETRRSLQGLGGCTAVSLRELTGMPVLADPSSEGTASAAEPMLQVTLSQFKTLDEYVQRTTHWQEGGMTRHDAKVALKGIVTGNAVLQGLAPPYPC